MYISPERAAGGNPVVPEGNGRFPGSLSVVFKTPEMHIPPWYWFSSYQNGSPLPRSLPAVGHFTGTTIVDIYAGQLRQVVQFYSAPLAQLPAALDTTQLIRERREKLLQDRGTVENLGFPLRRRSGVPGTYVSPEVKRRIIPQLPPVSTRPYMPEPTLDLAEYEHILSVVSNMVVVMERSPRAFKDMGEEDLRQHFLVQLNGQYEG